MVVMMMLTATALACLLSHDGSVTAFSPLSVSHGSSNRRVSSSGRLPFVTVVLEAKKKRRRKENANTDPLQEEDDDLPDFDLKEDQDVDAAPPVARQRKRPTTMNSLETEVTPAMMATSSSTTNSSPRSIRDLISDRSLESKFDFEGEVAPEEAPADLPDLLQIARETDAPLSGTVGKKKARQQARRAAALAAKAEEEQQNPLAQFAFLTNEEGKLVPTKILEAGAWAGIGLLVLWEFYINSPLFDRAAPMAPVVY